MDIGLDDGRDQAPEEVVTLEVASRELARDGEWTLLLGLWETPEARDLAVHLGAILDDSDACRSGEDCYRATFLRVSCPAEPSFRGQTCTVDVGLDDAYDTSAEEVVAVPAEISVRSSGGFRLDLTGAHSELLRTAIGEALGVECESGTCRANFMDVH